MNNMKNIFAIAFAVFALGTTSMMAQGVDIGPPMDGAIIEVENETIDFGTLPHQGDASSNFIVWNRGTQDLVISFCKGSCGCTVPTCPTEAIAPGQSGKIAVKYDSNRIGYFTKNVTVTSNAINEPNKTLTIKGNIEAPVTPPVAAPNGGQAPTPAPVPAGGH